MHIFYLDMYRIYYEDDIFLIRVVTLFKISLKISHNSEGIQYCDMAMGSSYTIQTFGPVFYPSLIRSETNWVKGPIL